jgi:hypothetical protein
LEITAMTMLEVIGLVLCFLGFAILYELEKIRSAVEMTEAIHRKQMFG